MAVETTYTQLRDQLASVLNRVVEDQEVVIVRRRGAKDVALIAASELASVLETTHLLRSPKTHSDCLVPCGARLNTKENRNPSKNGAGKWDLGRAAERDAVFHPEFREDLRY